MIKQTEITLVPCDSCGGIGTLPGPRTGHLMKRLRESRSVTLLQLLEFFPYKKTYTCDLEKDYRPWNNELVRLYKQAMDDAVKARLEKLNETN